jgi:hypothetical protein
VAGAVTLQQNGDRIELLFSFWANKTWPREFILDWAQISDIMHEVKAKGVQRKDAELGVSYLAKEFKPEVQK